MRTTVFKVYDPEGNYQAATKRIEEAAAVVALLGNGATIRYRHKKKATLWTEGADGFAGNSYDEVADLAHIRLNAYIQSIRKRVRLGGV